MSELGGLQITHRSSLGMISHTFSHIQQTMHVELLVLEVFSGTCTVQQAATANPTNPISSIPQVLVDLRGCVDYELEGTVHELHDLQGELGMISSLQPQRKVQWLSARNLTETGLSSGVKKVHKMVLGKQALADRRAAGQKHWKQQRLK